MTRIMRRYERNQALLQALSKPGTATREELQTATGLEYGQLSDALLDLGLSGQIEVSYSPLKAGSL